MDDWLAVRAECLCLVVVEVDVMEATDSRGCGGEEGRGMHSALDGGGHGCKRRGGAGSPLS